MRPSPLIRALALLAFAACGQSIVVLPARDAGQPDGGQPTDGGVTDGGAPDGGAFDGGADAGPSDAGGTDAGPGDAGQLDSGIREFTWTQFCQEQGSAAYTGLGIGGQYLYIATNDGRLYRTDVANCGGKNSIRSGGGTLNAVIVTRDGGVFAGGLGVLVRCTPSCQDQITQGVLMNWCEMTNGPIGAGFASVNGVGAVSTYTSPGGWNTGLTSSRGNSDCYYSDQLKSGFITVDGGLLGFDDAPIPLGSSLPGGAFTAAGGNASGSLRFAGTVNGRIIQSVNTGAFAELPSASTNPIFDFVELSPGEFMAVTATSLLIQDATGAFVASRSPPISVRAVAVVTPDRILAAGSDPSGEGVVWVGVR